MSSKVSKSVDLDASADKVWGKIGDSNSLADCIRRSPIASCRKTDNCASSRWATAP